MEFHIIVVQTFDVPVLSAMAATTVTKSDHQLLSRCFHCQPKVALSRDAGPVVLHAWQLLFHLWCLRPVGNTSSCFFFLIDMFLSIMKSYISLNVITGEGIPSLLLVWCKSMSATFIISKPRHNWNTVTSLGEKESFHGRCTPSVLFRKTVLLFGRALGFEHIISIFGLTEYVHHTTRRDRDDSRAGGRTITHKQPPTCWRRYGRVHRNRWKDTGGGNAVPGWA